MLVKVNTSLAGADFSFRFGEEVESEEFAAKVGNGWQNLCEPVDGVPIEAAVAPPAEENAVVPVPVEVAVEPAPTETTSRKTRRK